MIIRMIEEKVTKKEVSFVNSFKECMFISERINLIDGEIEKVKKAAAKNGSRVNDINIIINLMLQEDENLADKIRENYIRRYLLLVENKQYGRKISRLNSLRKNVIINSWLMACMLK